MSSTEPGLTSKKCVLHPDCCGKVFKQGRNLLSLDFVIYTEGFGGQEVWASITSSYLLVGKNQFADQDSEPRQMSCYLGYSLLAGKGTEDFEFRSIDPLSPLFSVLRSCLSLTLIHSSFFNYSQISSC